MGRSDGSSLSLEKDHPFLLNMRCLFVLLYARYKIYIISHLTVLSKDIIQELHSMVCRITTLGRVEYSIYPNPTYQHPLVYIGKKAMIRITYRYPATANSSYPT